MATTPSIYRMKVHLFGVALSPGCANSGLKHLAAQRQAFKLSRKPSNLLKNQENFGRLRLHKFVSNSENVMATILEEERITIKDLRHGLEFTHMERALGVEWFITSHSNSFEQIQSSSKTKSAIKKRCALYHSLYV
ncbi:hypothetical protein N1851_014132 [Merluccius polli]|uniref:Uncharacterized protein n=1 Tax=Merluccius polli TaxID=89951 RepID=A0AA47MUS8_MERPO|nr:hypothetical protein N1851_014132 [Merluccius polli]